MLSILKRFVREDEGMEMLEWAIVGVVFAVAGVAAWAALQTALSQDLADIAAGF